MTAHSARQRIGIYGGTFNPIHNGHLLVAQTALEALGLTRIIFVPAGIPPLKGAQQLIDGQQRLMMVQLAIADDAQFTTSDFEVQRDHQKSFTLDTVRFLVGQYPRDTQFFFILGDDCVDKLHHWKGIDELKQLVQFVCVNRLGVQPLDGAPELLHIAMPTVEISSSLLRERLRAGKAVRHFCPATVADYIEKNRLYCAAAPTAGQSSPGEPQPFEQIAHV